MLLPALPQETRVPSLHLEIRFHHQEVWEEASLPASFLTSLRLMNHNQGSEKSCSKESNPSLLTAVFLTIMGSTSSFQARTLLWRRGSADL